MRAAITASGSLVQASGRLGAEPALKPQVVPGHLLRRKRDAARLVVQLRGKGNHAEEAEAHAQPQGALALRLRERRRVSDCAESQARPSPRAAPPAAPRRATRTTALRRAPATAAARGRPESSRGACCHHPTAARRAQESAARTRVSGRRAAVRPRGGAARVRRGPRAHLPSLRRSLLDRQPRASARGGGGVERAQLAQEARLRRPAARASATAGCTLRARRCAQPSRGLTGARRGSARARACRAPPLEAARLEGQLPSSWRAAWRKAMAAKRGLLSCAERS